MPTLTSPQGTLVSASESLAGRLARLGWKHASTRETGPESDSEQPAKTASRAKWADYAESLGFDTDGLTKAQIIDAVG